MKIEHIALWVKKLEPMREFYERYFDLTSNNKYTNEQKQFSSYFLSFENGARIELMHRPDIAGEMGSTSTRLGLTHFAISVGSREKVNELTERIRKDGHKIFGEPRLTGDGYYESVIVDPEGNLIEITE